MPIPTVEELLAPVLRQLGSGMESSAELADHLAAQLGLTESEKLDQVAGSGQTVFRNRLSWALVWFGKAGLVSKLGTGRYGLTEEGRRLLDTNPVSLTIADMNTYPGFKYYKTGGMPPALTNPQAGGSTSAPSQTTQSIQTPMEQISTALAVHNLELEGILLAEIHALSPTDFELLVVRVIGRVLLPTAASHRLHHVGKSGDGGVDGVVDEDALGLSRVFLQAKKYSVGNTVGVAEIHQFAGAMSARGASKGVFVTASDFTAGARAAAEAVAKSHTIRLIGGADFVRMMINNAIGVREVQRVVLYGPDLASLLSGD